MENYICANSLVIGHNFSGNREIIKLKKEHRQRVWALTFTAVPCFMYHCFGTVYQFSVYAQHVKLDQASRLRVENSVFNVYAEKANCCCQAPPEEKKKRPFLEAGNGLFTRQFLFQRSMRYTARLYNHKLCG